MMQDSLTVTIKMVIILKVDIIGVRRKRKLEVRKKKKSPVLFCLSCHIGDSFEHSFLFSSALLFFSLLYVERNKFSIWVKNSSAMKQFVTLSKVLLMHSKSCAKEKLNLKIVIIPVFLFPSSWWIFNRYCFFPFSLQKAFNRTTKVLERNSHTGKNSRFF